MAEKGSIKVKRHYHDLSPKEIDELVGIVADLIVDYLKGRDCVRTYKPEVNQEVQA